MDEKLVTQLNEIAIDRYKTAETELTTTRAALVACAEALEWYADYGEKLYRDHYDDGGAAQFDRNGGSELGDDEGMKAHEALTTHAEAIKAAKN